MHPRNFRRPRHLAVVAALALGATSLAACGGGGGAGLLAAIEVGTVKVGTKYDQPGLGMRAPDGSMSGLDVDVAEYVVEHIAEAKGWDAPQIEWTETPSAQRETLIQNGQVDMIAATYSINKGRSESVNFGGPYLLTHQALLVTEADREIQSLEDLDGKILCSVTGSTPAQTVKDELPGVQLQEYDTYSGCVEALGNGSVDAMTTDATILGGYSAQRPGEFRLVELTGSDGEPFTDEYYGVGLKKDDQEATDAINAALEELISSGEWTRLVEENLGGTEGVVEGSVGDLSFLDG
ncbi:glutamate-binding protein [Corynebacterium frankenforstense DSM 45800]|uniref:Glutamate-binding protein n=1 Tax=Corynebacterium frankenforstense DSM 45800 TaxID=1437875 RepID=A0A1L7CTB9_9CORY|nr:glutamate ABC transporter substrate-binding protein [Corynebacterium frankenforstense]APT89061.1 glutamate-binding protein [Corynebacterium frankenforstense DSM 45800]